MKGKPVGQRCSEYFVLLAWIAQRALLQEEAIVHENVPNFMVALLQQTLGKYYVISSIVMDSAEFGIPNDRRRRITFLRHKRTLVANTCTLGDFVAMCRRGCEATWEMFLIASQAELEEELAWARNRPSSRSHSQENTSGMHFVDALTQSEKNSLENYMERWPGNAVANLNQNPERHPQCNKGRPNLHTLFKNTGMLFSFKHMRWLTPTEILSVLMFPVRGGYFGETSSFSRSRESCGMPARSRSVMIEQAGNSMSVPVVAIPILWWLLVRRPEFLKPDTCLATSLSEALGKAATCTLRRLNKRKLITQDTV